MEYKFYIAYGSNLNIKQMRKRCPSTHVIGTAVIENYELLFKGSKTGSYLTIEPKEGSRVPVAIWETTSRDEEYLDRYEGFPTFYYKKEMELDVKDIGKDEVKRRKCFVYIMHEDRQIGLPDFRYFKTCLEGYETFGFDEEILAQALETSRRRFHERRD